MLTVLLVGSAALLIIDRIRKMDGWPHFKPPTKKPVVSSGWGESRDYRATSSNPHPKHYGLDFRASVGTPIYALGSGKVSMINEKYDTHAGYWIRVNHGEGVSSEYLHLSKINVRPGDVVNNDTIIGLSGDTGVSGPGSHVPHLHLTIRMDKNALRKYRERYNTPDGGFINTNRAGVAVPGEPIVPASYTSNVIASANKRGVSPPKVI